MVAEIDAWLQAQKGSGNADQLAGIMRTVVRLANDNAGRGDVKILNRAMQELRHAFRIFAPYRQTRKVSIFGSTRCRRAILLSSGAEPGAGFSGRWVHGDHRRRTGHHASRA
jgi:hypothetical protein